MGSCAQTLGHSWCITSESCVTSEASLKKVDHQGRFCSLVPLPLCSLLPECDVMRPAVQYSCCQAFCTMMGCPFFLELFPVPCLVTVARKLTHTLFKNVQIQATRRQYSLLSICAIQSGCHLLPHRMLLVKTKIYFILFFETRSCYITQAFLELVIPQP